MTKIPSLDLSCMAPSYLPDTLITINKPDTMEFKNGATIFLSPLKSREPIRGLTRDFIIVDFQP